jgi:hypothetical protein
MIDGKFNLWKGRTVSWMFVCAILLLIFILSQLAFLSADADPVISTKSRGAWTDEGLNTHQIREYVQFGQLDLLDGDNLLKTPLFSFFLSPFFKFIGISLELARVLTVLFCALTTFFIFRRKELAATGISFIVLTLFFFPVHQYAHLSLAEIYASILIVAGIISYAFSDNRKETIVLVRLYLLLLLAVLFKVQFIYVLGLPVFISIVEYFLTRSRNDLLPILRSIGILMLTLTGMFALWYLPFAHEWSRIAEIQPGLPRFDELSLGLIKENIKRLLLSERYLLFTLMFILCAIYVLFGLFKRSLSHGQKVLVFLSFGWVLVESHKLCMIYIPMRYLISFYVSMGLFIAIVLGILMSKERRTALVFGLPALMLVLQNIYYLKVSASERTFAVKNMNSYIGSIAQEGDVVIGPWAPAVTWEARVHAYPIWVGFLGERNILHYYKPDFIISEPQEQDSDGAYRKNGILLDSIGDAVYSERIAEWDLIVYKTKKP